MGKKKKKIRAFGAVRLHFEFLMKRGARHCDALRIKSDLVYRLAVIHARVCSRCCLEATLSLSAKPLISAPVWRLTEYKYRERELASTHTYTHIYTHTTDRQVPSSSIRRALLYRACYISRGRVYMFLEHLRAILNFTATSYTYRSDLAYSLLRDVFLSRGDSPLRGLFALLRRIWLWFFRGNVLIARGTYALN